MESLLELLSNTQSALKKVNMKLDSPIVAVLGSQSAGKSSVLESMINLDLLPKKSGLCTRVPLELTLIHEELPVTVASFSHLSEEENMKFSTPDEETNLEAIREEISNRTDQLTAPNEILDKPIFLVVRSSKVSNLRLIDLPGVTKISTSGQDNRIVEVIKNLVKKYIVPSKTLILAVSPANMDLANSDSLGMAREVDPTGERTIGVLTKIDLMDKGTDCLDVLENKVHVLKHGYIPVINRSQHDLTTKVSLEQAKEKESNFFMRSPTYSVISQRAGSRFLTSSVSELLIDKIRYELPAIRRQLEVNQQQIEAQIRDSGISGEQPTERQMRMQMSEMIKVYCENIKASLDGNMQSYKKDSDVEEKIIERINSRKKEQQKKMSTSYAARIDGNLNIKRSMMYHNRYVVSNNGSITWYKSQTNLNNPKTYSLADYDVTLSNEDDIFLLTSEESSITFKAESKAERDRWVGAIKKGREFLEAAGKKIYKIPVKTPKKEKKKEKEVKEKSSSSAFGNLKEHLLKSKNPNSHSGSFIKMSYLMEFIPEIEKDKALDVALGSGKGKENAVGYRFLPEEMTLPYVFENLVSSIVSSMKGSSLKWLEKVENVFADMIQGALPSKIETYSAFKTKILHLTHDYVKSCIDEIREEAEYEFDLNAENLNCEEYYFLKSLPEKPKIDDYLRTYVEQFKINVVGLVWKLVMVLLVKRTKEELRENLQEEVYRMSNSEIERIFQVDPVEAERVRKLKMSLDEIKSVSNELSIINI